MRHYHIFLIEDEVAETFFGEESKLFHLFLEAEKASTFPQIQTLQKQVDYITKPIFYPDMEKKLEVSLSNRGDYYTRPGYHLLQSNVGESRAELSLGKRRMLMKASGSFEAETTFFEVLRQQERCFLAMEFHQQRYGWLNPIKQTHFV